MNTYKLILTMYPLQYITVTRTGTLTIIMFNLTHATKHVN